MLFTSLVIIAAAVPSVFAHGIVSQLTINGKAFKGLLPNGRGGNSAIRQVTNAGPVLGASNAEMTCGHSVGPASSIADAMPGDTLSFDWKTFDGKANWFHAVGPILTYLAPCGSADCSKFNAAKAKWFKIAEDGLVDGKWVQAQLTQGKPATAQLPSTLAPGGYLVRHEVIALHNALSVGGAEFYPACAQIKVGGSETGAPKESELVQFPGAYSDDDAGILVPDIFNPGFKYDFPGPPVSSLSGSAGGDTPVPAPEAPTSSKAAAPAPTKEASASSGSTRASSARVSATPAPAPSPVTPPIAVAPRPTLSSVVAEPAPTASSAPSCKRRKSRRSVVKTHNMHRRISHMH